jgi:hypothetical protein
MNQMAQAISSSLFNQAKATVFECVGKRPLIQADLL